MSIGNTKQRTVLTIFSIIFQKVPSTQVLSHVQRTQVLSTQVSTKTQPAPTRPGLAQLKFSYTGDGGVRKFPCTEIFMWGGGLQGNLLARVRGKFCCKGGCKEMSSQGFEENFPPRGVARKFSCKGRKCPCKEVGRKFPQNTSPLAAVKISMQGNLFERKFLSKGVGRKFPQNPLGPPPFPPCMKISVQGNFPALKFSYRGGGVQGNFPLTLASVSQTFIHGRNNTSLAARKDHTTLLRSRAACHAGGKGNQTTRTERNVSFSDCLQEARCSVRFCFEIICLITWLVQNLVNINPNLEDGSQQVRKIVVLTRKWEEKRSIFDVIDLARK